MKFDIWNFFGGSFGSQAAEADLHWSFSHHLFDPLLFDLFALVCSHGGVEEHPPLPSFNLQHGPGHSGLSHVSGRVAPRLHHFAGKRYLPLP